MKILKAVAAIDAAPERKFAAALLGSSLEAVRSGDPEAREWIEMCAVQWLPLLTPPGGDPDQIHRRLLDAAGMGAAP